MYLFWKKVIGKLFQNTLFRFTLVTEEVLSIFVLHNRIPCGLLNVLREMLDKGILVKLDDIKSREYYESKKVKTEKRGIFGWMKKSIVDSATHMLFGKSKTEQDKPKLKTDDVLVYIPFLEKATQNLVKWTEGINTNVFSEEKLRRQLRDVNFTESDIDLIFIHARETGCLKTFSINLFSKAINCMKIQSSDKIKEITDVERALVAIRLSIDNFDDKLESLDNKINELVEDIKRLLKDKKKDRAKHKLIAKKNYDKYWEKLATLKNNLEEQMFNIQNMEANDNMYSALKLAELANNTMKKDVTEFENLLEKLDQQKDASDEVSNLVASKAISVEEEDELNQELEELEEGDDSTYATRHSIKCERMETQEKDKEMMMENLNEMGNDKQVDRNKSLFMKKSEESKPIQIKKPDEEKQLNTNKEEEKKIEHLQAA